MKYTCCMCLLLTIPVWTAGASERFFETPVLISLLKEDDAAILETHPRPEEQQDTDNKETARERAWIPGARFGLLYPGPSSDTGDFSFGPSAGGYIHFALGQGTLEATGDIAGLKAPSDVEGEYRLLFMAGVNYLFPIEHVHLGAGVTLANASPVNELLLFQAACSIHLRKRVDISLTVYIPAGNPNNSYMIGLYAGYRF